MKIDVAGSAKCPHTQQAWDMIAKSKLFRKLDCDANPKACEGVEAYPTFMVRGKECARGKPASLDSLPVCKLMAENKNLAAAEMMLNQKDAMIEALGRKLQQCDAAYSALAKPAAPEYDPPFLAGETEEEAAPAPAPAPVPTLADAPTLDKTIYVAGKSFCKFTRDSWAMIGENSPFQKLDCDAQPDVCHKLGITAYPSFVVDSQVCHRGKPDALHPDKLPGCKKLL